MSTTIRPARFTDIAAITEIYNDAGVGTTASYDLEPVSIRDREAWFRSHQAANFPILVAEIDGRVAGYAAYGTFREKAGYTHTRWNTASTSTATIGWPGSGAC